MDKHIMDYLNHHRINVFHTADGIEIYDMNTCKKMQIKNTKRCD